MDYNYASHECGARLLVHGPSAHTPSAILRSTTGSTATRRGDSHKLDTNNDHISDSYMLDECKKERFVMIELCEPVQVESIVLGNYELHASMSRSFTVSIARRRRAVHAFLHQANPDNGSGNAGSLDRDWTVLGTFGLQNVKRQAQPFRMPTSPVFARFIRVDFSKDVFDTKSFFCAVSTVRVYGRTMMEDFEQQMATVGGQHARRSRRSNGRLFGDGTEKCTTTERLSGASYLLPFDRHMVHDIVPLANSDEGDQNIYRAMHNRMLALERRIIRLESQLSHGPLLNATDIRDKHFELGKTVLVLLFVMLVVEMGKRLIVRLTAPAAADSPAATKVLDKHK